MRNLNLLLIALLFIGCGEVQPGPGGVASGTNSNSAQAQNSPSYLARGLSAAEAPTGPSNFLGNPVQPRVTENFQGPIPTNDWWTSLLWPFYPGNEHGENLFAHPKVLKSFPNGLALGYPTEPQLTEDGVHYLYHFREDLRVGLSGLNAHEVRVDDHSDWTVTARWQGGPTMWATTGHGLPFTYFTGVGAGFQVQTVGALEVFHQQNNVLGLTVNGAHYALFGPTGTAWTGHGTFSNPGPYLSVALLPERSALPLFTKYAYSFITDTKAEYHYDRNTGLVTTDFQVTTEAKEGTETGTLLALYRHQWLNTSTPTTPYSYWSPRGEMKLVEGAGFTTEHRYTGVLPAPPDVGGHDRQRLRSYVLEVAQEGPLPPKDTYFGGKDLGRLAAVIPIAEELGETQARDAMLDKIRHRLDDYFDGEEPFMLAYNSTWNALLAYPAAFESDRQLNDHHFHYAYLIMGAATVARYDQAWAEANLEAVEELIANVANFDRECTRYPYLRNFDPYAGHSWASGPQMFAGGNNQESSSEAINFATAVLLWAAETNHQDLEALGAYLYATETTAIEQYWFDVDQAVFPEGFAHPVLGMVWGAGGAYTTWWTNNPEEIHGINYLPITGGSFYLGRDPDKVRGQVQHLETQNGGPAQEWRDIIWSYLAFAENTVLNRFYADPDYPVEGGESRAHTYHWLGNLSHLGQQDPTVSADLSTFAVFLRDGLRTYVAYNPQNTPRTVTFSDGTTLDVPPKSTRWRTGSADSSPSPDPQPSPEPTPTPEPELGAFTGTLYLKGSQLATESPSLDSKVILPSATGLNFDGRPEQTETLTISGLTADYSGGGTEFEFLCDAGHTVGAAVQARLLYDFDGDGVVDRTETYHYFPTNDLPGWELYCHTRGLLETHGAFQNFRNGSLTLQLWSAIGNGPTVVGTGPASESQLVLPYGSGTADSGNPTPSPDPEPPEPPADPTPDPPPAQDPPPQSPELQIPEAVLPSPNGVNHDGRPFQPLVLTFQGLNGPGGLEFEIPVDAGSKVGAAVQLRASYDYNGDGTVDRVETYRYFATNDIPNWEIYHQGAGLLRSTGSIGSFAQGRLTLELWVPIGSAEVTVGPHSSIRLR